jgi:hypothetical protein
MRMNELNPVLLTALLKMSCEAPHLRVTLRMMYQAVAQVMPDTKDSRDKLAVELEEAADNVPVARPEGWDSTELAECVLGYSLASAVIESVDVATKLFTDEAAQFGAQMSADLDDFQNRYA